MNADAWRVPCPPSIQSIFVAPTRKGSAMPELIRSVVSRVRVYFRDRRQSPRLRTRLSFTISLCRKSNSNGLQPRAQALKGYTRDLSMNGLALLVPKVHLDGHHLAAEGRELQLTLELPGGSISMQIIPHRYEQLEVSECGCAYVIGAKILQIDDEDRMRYSTFIKERLAA